MFTYYKRFFFVLLNKKYAWNNSKTKQKLKFFKNQ